MSFLDNQEREMLVREHETLRKDNWERGHTVWIVNTILITGSLLIVFQTITSDEFPTPIVSLFLVVVSFLTNATSDRVTEINFQRMEEIRERLGMTGPTEIYRRRIEGKWWYSIRRNLPYVLYLVMASVYVLVITDNFCIFRTVLIVGFFAILIREVLGLVKRWIRESRRNT